MEEWKEYRLGELLEIPIRNGLTKPKAIRGQGVKMIGMKEIFAYDIIRDCDMELVPVTEKELASSLILQEDLLFARQSLTLEGAGKCSIVASVSDNTVFESHLIRLRINKKIANPYFIYYYFSSRYGKEQIKGLVQQVAAAGIRGKELINLIISIPSLPTQQKIANILSSLDDKIEVNRRINAELEELAQSLFKSWFVDFEPFKDSEFVESELGMIPKGWKVGTFSQIVQSTLGGDWGKETEQGNYTKKVFCIRGADIPEIKSGNRGKMPIRFILDKNFQKKALEANDLVVEISGGSPTQSTGRVCRVTDDLLEKYDYSLICTNFCRAIKPANEYSSYIYYHWQYLYDIGRMFNYENGTTGIKNLMINDIIEKEIVIIPPVNIAEEFGNVTRTISAKIQKNGEETKTLTALRDTLLPKLMSGEIDVNE